MPELPTGTVTFLFTDIEGSTRLLTEAGSDYRTLLEEHRRLIGAAVERADGTVFGTEGDAVFAVFHRAGAALAAASDLQHTLLEHPWPGGRQVRVRAGIHSGEVTVADGDYVGLPIHEVARISAAAHGGQVIVSATTRALASDSPPAGIELRDLGEHRLKDVAQPVRLYQLVGEGLPHRFPPPRTLAARSDTLPPQLNSFIDRGELDEGKRLLHRARLLTLTGPGGTGKTRLALELARELGDDYADGVSFVPLDAIRDPELVPSAIMTSLGLAEGSATGGGPIARLVDYLRERSMLIVVDNFEQVIEGAPMVADLLRASARTKMIVTSRIPLRLAGEQEFPIPPLGLPQHGGIGPEQAMQSAAVQLFVDRAAAARPDFRLSDENAAAVVDVVTRLDGLPLAIELAAARLRVLSVDALRERLDKRMAVLTGGARDLPARQQTLRSTVEWSYELLDSPDRALFERFGVFANAACLVEAEPVCGPPDELGEEVLDGLISLTEKSLLRPVPRALAEPRFAVLATIRDYATDRLAGRSEVESLRRRHAETYLTLVEQAAPQLLGPRGKQLLDRLEQDHDNVRLSLDWAIEHDEADVALRLLAGIWRFWQIRGHLHEGWEQAQRVLAMPSVSRQPPGLRARALGAAGGVAYWREDGLAAHELYREALELARTAGDRRLLAEALTNFGYTPEPSTQSSAGLYGGGRPFFEEAASLYRELGDQDGLAGAIWALAFSAANSGDLDGAGPLIQEGLALARASGNQFAIGWSLFGLAWIGLKEGRIGDAVRSLVESLRIFEETGDVSGITSALVGLTAGGVGVPKAPTWRLRGAGKAFAERYGVGFTETGLGYMDVESLDRPIDDVEAQREWDTGAAMAVDEAVAYAYEVAAQLEAARRPAVE